jgi:two-component system cell cycle sensor histidine kinase/response regulator CckA
MDSDRKTILLAEDDEAVREFVKAVLSVSQFNVITAVDANDAMEKAAAWEGRIDLLLSNIQMPGMTGIELATQLQRQRPEMKVLLMSGLQTGILVLDEGWQFLPKPFVPNMLRDKIRAMLGETQKRQMPESGAWGG